MPSTPKVERYEIITPVSLSTDDFGNLNITTTLNKEVRINKKHESLHDQFIEGRATKVGYAVYMEKEYVHTAELYDGVMEEPQPAVEPGKLGIPETLPLKAPAPQELGMWWKEAGETLRALDSELKQHPMYIVLANAYIHKMFEVLGLKIPKGD